MLPPVVLGETEAFMEAICMLGREMNAVLGHDSAPKAILCRGQPGLDNEINFVMNQAPGAGLYAGSIVVMGACVNR